MKRKRTRSQMWLAIALIAGTALVSILISSLWVRVLCIGIVLIIAVLYHMIFFNIQQHRLAIAAEFFEKNSKKMDKYLNTASIPTVMVDRKGKITWCNPPFYHLTGTWCEGSNLYKLLPDLNMPDKDNKIMIGGVIYSKEATTTQLENRLYTVYRFIDRENAQEAAKLSQMVRPVICHVQIDNFAELLRGTEQKMHFEIESEIERIIARHAEEIHAIYQRYDRYNYLLIFERRYLRNLISAKFDMLQEVRDVDTGREALFPTLSIGVGVGESPANANESALKALEMALGRGGDQAVLKDENDFKFFGGIQRGRETRSRVKTRMFAKAFRNLMEQCERVVVLGHEVPDLDCMGAALGVLACARSIGKPCHIVLDKMNISIEALVDTMNKNPEYEGVMIDPAQAESYISQKMMLVVVDTQIASFTITPELYHKAAGHAITVVIDHHVRGTDYIDDATLFLHEPYASSTAEMVTEVIQYFAENVVLKPLEVEALLAGITMDTKGFSYKTGVRTFEAASYLRGLGADASKIRHLFEDDLATYKTRAKVVEDAEVLEGGIAISSVSKDETENPRLLSAQAADELIGILGIGASFVLCEVDEYTMISGRSVGEINVQRILEKMGGGGHATIAGAQIKNSKMYEVKQLLKEKIEEYEREVL